MSHEHHCTHVTYSPELAMETGKGYVCVDAPEQKGCGAQMSYNDILNLRQVDRRVVPA